MRMFYCDTCGYFPIGNEGDIEAEMREQARGCPECGEGLTQIEITEAEWEAYKEDSAAGGQLQEIEP